MDTNDHPYDTNEDLMISNNSMRFLKETGGWGKLLAIIGFCFVGLLVLGSFFIGSLFSTYSEIGSPMLGYFVSFLYIVLAVVYFFPILYLFKFSTQIKTALIDRDNALVEVAFENLKSHYKFVGIVTIIMLGIYVLFGLGVLVFGVAMF